MCTYSDTLYAKKCTFFVLGVNSDTPCIKNAPFCVQFFLESLYIKPTLTATRFGESFLYNGVLDLNKEGCNLNIDGGCVV